MQQYLPKCNAYKIENSHVYRVVFAALSKLKNKTRNATVFGPHSLDEMRSGCNSGKLGSAP